MDWVIADTHFNHSAIVNYCFRPFKNVAEMDEHIIGNWNSVVGRHDHVYHLGDFSFASADLTRHYVEQLNGEITLVLGNHDKARTITFWKKRGINAVKGPLDIGLVVLSHEPVLYPGKPNVHGHTHGNVHRGDVSEHGVHYCVSVECTGYKPLPLPEVISACMAMAPPVYSFHGQGAEKEPEDTGRR